MAKYRVECKEPNTDWFVHLDNLTFSAAKRHLVIAIQKDADDQQSDEDFDVLDDVALAVEEWDRIEDTHTVSGCGYGYRIVRDDGEHRKLEESAMEGNHR